MQDIITFFVGQVSNVISLLNGMVLVSHGTYHITLLHFIGACVVFSIVISAFVHTVHK